MSLEGHGDGHADILTSMTGTIVCISDHHSVECVLDVSKPPKVSSRVKKRNFRTFDADCFHRDVTLVCDQILQSVHELVSGYTTIT
jgi:hypothetical protein